MYDMYVRSYPLLYLFGVYPGEGLIRRIYAYFPCLELNKKGRKICIGQRGDATDFSYDMINDHAVRYVCILSVPSIDS